MKFFLRKWAALRWMTFLKWRGGSNTVFVELFCSPKKTVQKQHLNDFFEFYHQQSLCHTVGQSNNHISVRIIISIKCLYGWVNSRSCFTERPIFFTEKAFLTHISSKWKHFFSQIVNGVPRSVRDDQGGDGQLQHDPLPRRDGWLFFLWCWGHSTGYFSFILKITYLMSNPY